MLLQNRSEYEVCLPSNTPVAEAQSACRKQEVCIDLEEDNLVVSVYDIIDDYESNEEVITNLNLDVGDDSSGVSLPVGVKLNDLSAEEEEKVAKLLNEHKDVFSKGSFDLGECGVVPHEIHVVDGPPIRLPYRRLPPSQVNNMEEMLQEDVCQIRPAFDGPAKWVNRRRLTIDPREVDE